MTGRTSSRTHRTGTLARSLAVAAGAALGLAGLGGCQGGHGKYTAEHLTTATERVNGMKAKNHFDMAKQAYLSGDLAKAMKAIEQSIGLADGRADSFVLKGRIQIEQSDLEGAIASFERAESLDPKNVEAQYFWGIVHERFTQKDKALARYLKACELEPANPQYAVAAAEMMCDVGRLDEAETFLNSRTSSFEHNAGVRQTLAHIAMIKGDRERGVDLFNEARLLAPDDEGILEDLVRAQISTGRFAEAEYNINKLLAMKDNEARRDLLHMRARCLTAVDRPVEAREILLGLTKDAAGAKDIEAWIELGNASCVLRDMNNLRGAASRVIALAPARHEGYTLRAIWSLRKGDAKAALESIDKAVERRAGATEPLVMRGLILEQLGRPADARASYLAALKQDPKNREVAALVSALKGAGPVAAATDK